MPIRKMSDMWSALQAVTIGPTGKERAVNHLNEWGGFSKRLNMPVFTAWKDGAVFDKETKLVKALVCNSDWSSAVGVNNQEHWLAYAEQNGGRAAFFIIHAVDEKADPRKVSSIDDNAVFIGEIVREGTKTFIKGMKTPL